MVLVFEITVETSNYITAELHCSKSCFHPLDLKCEQCVFESEINHALCSVDLVDRFELCALCFWVSVTLSTKIEKEKRELAKQYGMVRTEVSGGEIAEELEKERRMFQLHMCEVRVWRYNRCVCEVRVS